MFVLSSTWLTVVMAVSRYVVVCRPLHARGYISLRRTRCALLAVYHRSSVSLCVSLCPAGCVPLYDVSPRLSLCSSVSMCLSLSVSITLCALLDLFLSLSTFYCVSFSVPCWLCFCVSLSLCLSLFIFLCVRVSLCLAVPLCLCPAGCVSLYHCSFVFLFFCISVSLFVSLYVLLAVFLLSSVVNVPRFLRYSVVTSPCSQLGLDSTNQTDRCHCVLYNKVSRACKLI